LDKDLFKKTEGELYNYKGLDIKIKSIEMDIEMLQNDITLKAINYNEKSGPTNAFNSSVENEVIRRDEVVKEQIQKLQNAKKFYMIKKNKIENALQCLNDEEIKLVEMRYFQKVKNNWTKIGFNLGMDRMTCSRLRNKIIKKLSDFIFN
jgi:RinA family phage transcriptional activator